MNKERYFIWKNMDALQELIDSLNNNSEDSPESSEDNNTEGEGENNG